MLPKLTTDRNPTPVLHAPFDHPHRLFTLKLRQLAEQYGDEVASDVLLRSRNKMNSFSQSGGGTAPSSPLTQSVAGLPASSQPQARATGVDARTQGAPPSSYAFSGPGGNGNNGGGAAGGQQRNSGYGTYGSSAYQMNMLGKGPGE